MLRGAAVVRRGRATAAGGCTRGALETNVAAGGAAWAPPPGRGEGRPRAEGRAYAGPRTTAHARAGGAGADVAIQSTSPSRAGHRFLVREGRREMKRKANGGKGEDKISRAAPTHATLYRPIQCCGLHCICSVFQI